MLNESALSFLDLEAAHQDSRNALSIEEQLPMLEKCIKKNPKHFFAVFMDPDTGMKYVDEYELSYPKSDLGEPERLGEVLDFFQIPFNLRRYCYMYTPNPIEHKMVRLTSHKSNREYSGEEIKGRKLVSIWIPDYGINPSVDARGFPRKGVVFYTVDPNTEEISTRDLYV